MALPPLAIANLIAQAAQAKAGQPTNLKPQGPAGPVNPKAKQAAAIAEKTGKKKAPPKAKKPAPPMAGPQGGLPPQGQPV